MSIAMVIGGAVIMGFAAAVVRKLGTSSARDGLTVGFLATLFGSLSMMAVGAALVLMGLWNVTP